MQWNCLVYGMLPRGTAKLRGRRVIASPGVPGSSSIISARLLGKKVLEDLYLGLDVTHLVGDRLICRPQAWWLGRDSFNLRACPKGSCAQGVRSEGTGAEMRVVALGMEKRGWRQGTDGSLTVIDTVRGIGRVTGLWVAIISPVWTCPIRDASEIWVEVLSRQWQIWYQSSVRGQDQWEEMWEASA